MQITYLCANIIIMTTFFSENALKLVLSLVIGGFIGIEREYSSKAAGFRTITLISIGSTLFTIISMKLGGSINADRIAANIITGIGFIGAGVVFKDGFSVTGLTTAASIWATSALGMAVGSGDYQVAAEGLVLVLVVLWLFEYVQGWIDNFHQKLSYKIVSKKNQVSYTEIENTLKEMNLVYSKRKEMKEDDQQIYYYDISGKREKIYRFNSFLINSESIKSFEY